MNKSDYDYIVIGSGFGGSVAALRLAEKGYKVLVLEKGKRWDHQDFPKTNWNLKKSLWMPWLRFFGILQMRFFKQVFVLSGVGVGGGSLVYANTHMVPESTFYEDSAWSRFGPWKELLKPYYQKARRMLGSAEYNKEYFEDQAFKELAKKMGDESKYRAVDWVGIYFSENQQARDPYFNGLGPLRKPCIECAGCMVGCRHNAKNTLDKNYLWLAEHLFEATILPEKQVYKIECNGSEGYKVWTQSSTSWFSKEQVFTTKGIVMSAGVLGTMQLLFDQKFKYKTLPNISDRLGTNIRTNSEMISGVTASPHKLNHGIAISKIMKPDEHTFIELCKYPDHSGAMYTLAAMAAGKGSSGLRMLKMMFNTFTHPLQWLRTWFQRDPAKHSIIFLVMQNLPSAWSMRAQRSWRGLRLKLFSGNGQKVPVFIPKGQEALMKYAQIVGGVPQNALTEIAFGMSTTAHFMGGCPMGENREEGVIDPQAKMHGYDHFYILDGSVLQANLGVNPSLTITAFSEYAMDQIPEMPGNTRKPIYDSQESMSTH